jgi:hypothetical protein
MAGGVGGSGGHSAITDLSLGLLSIFGDRGVFEETSKGNPVGSIILRSSSVGGGRGFCGSGLAARAMAIHIERWLRAMVDFL